jgi:hypothetical protein
VRSGTINSALLKMSASGGRDRVVCVPSPQGLAASTRYQVLLEAGGAGGVAQQKAEPVNLVALWPFQGRTHQLRVHCAEKLGRGCYILGDSKYGPMTSKQRFPSSCSSTVESRYLGGGGKQEEEGLWISPPPPPPQAKAVPRLMQDRTTVAEDGRRNGETAPEARRSKTRLCLHALRLTVNVAPDEREVVRAKDSARGEREREREREMRGGGEKDTVVDCVAEVPEHILATGEEAGISRDTLRAALGPLMSKKSP